MEKLRWLGYFLIKSIAQRKGRFLIASLAVMLATAVLTAFLLLSVGVRQKMSMELQRYGANMVITDKRGYPINHQIIDKLLSATGKIRSYQEHIYGTFRINGQTFEVTGMNKDALQGARLNGHFPVRANEVAVGVRLKDALQLELGDSIKDESTGESFKVSGIFEKGTKEDSSFVIDLSVARRLFNIKGVSALFLNVDTRYLDTFKKEIQKEFPFLRVKTIKQVALAEERLLRKIELLMIIVSVVVLFSAVVTLGSTVGANIIERMEEIGLMKALGARGADVKGFFLVEAVLFGALGAVTGFFVGIAVAEAVSKSAFNSFVSINPLWFPVLFLLSIGVSVFAAYLPVRGAMGLKPSQILRGE